MTYRFLTLRASNSEDTRTDASGFSVIELLLVMAILVVLAGISVSVFTQLIRSYRNGAATQQVLGDLRKARSEAILTGWQYRMVGYNAGADNEYRNHYRVLGRQSSAIAWPSETADAFQGATQVAREWVDIGARYPGVRLNPEDGSPEFAVAFDARGARIELDASFDPLVIATTGDTQAVTVSAAGNIKAQ